MTRTGLGSILSITTLIRATFCAMSLASISPADQATACSSQHGFQHAAAYDSSGQHSSGGFLA
jgi:hypothetical protein